MLPGPQTTLVLKDHRDIRDLLLRPQQVIIGDPLDQTPIVMVDQLLLELIIHSRTWNSMDLQMRFCQNLNIEKELLTGTSEMILRLLAFRVRSEPVNTGKLDPDDSPMPELKIFHKSETGIFDEASYDEEGVVTDFNSLPTEIEEEPKKISEALQDDSWVQAMQEELLQFKLQQLSDEEVYVSQPPGFVDPDHPKKVYKVVKALYGLHQALRAWYATLSTFLEKHGYKRGLQVKQHKEGIFISQDKYVAEILKKFDLVSVKTAITPMETKVALTKDEEAVDVDVTPKSSHLNAVKRIFKYLKGKPNLGLWYPRESPFDLEAFSDSDYGGSNLDRKSTTGGCQFLGQRLISWQCKKQTIVATSTTEAEYVAAANCCGQVLWVQNQLLDYGFNFMNTKIHIDNESTICIVKNPVYHSKTKHIEIRHHFIRDCYEKKLIRVEKIHTDLNVADLLTKPFDGPRNSMDLQMYALTTNPTIHDSLVKQFWQTATAKTLADGTLELQATIDTIEYTITEASIRSKLKLADASGITMLPNNEIFRGWGIWGILLTRKPIVHQPHIIYIVCTTTPPTTQPIPSEATTILPLSQPTPPTHIAETTTASSSPSPSPAHEPMEHTFEQPSSDQQPPTPRQEATTSYLMTRIDDLEKLLKETK
ncbi:putative ribonuclease H-like domain-containing protein [Tanacetum coccineum]